MRIRILLAVGLLYAGAVQAQIGSSISADGTAPNDNAMLDVQSPSTGDGKGMLIPRVSQAQRTTASSSLAGGLLNNSGELRGGVAQGLIVYQTDGAQGLYFNSSSTTMPSWSYLGDVAGFLTSNVWAAADSTTNYLPRTGGTMSGTLDMGGQIVTNATCYGDGRGITNLSAGAYTETDPRWTSASNSIVANINTRLASNVWAADGATTNYLPRTGGTMSGVLNMGGENVTNVSHIDFTGSGVSVGRSADSSGQGVAMGYQANGSSAAAAMGYQANSYDYGVAVGYHATGTSYGAAMGQSANGSSSGAALGSLANGNNYGVAVGNQANGSDNGVAIGYRAIGTNYSVAVGNAATGSVYGAALGYQANGSDSGAAVGYGANGYASGSVIGREANARSSGAAVGQSANGYNAGAAVGISANASIVGVAMGQSANGYSRGVAIGREANGSDYGAAVGYLAIGTNYGAAVGNEVNGSDYGAAVGNNANSYSQGAAVGNLANGSDYGAAVGRWANGLNSGVAIGYEANGYSSGAAMGRGANGAYGVAVGSFAKGTNFGTAVGKSANGSDFGVAVGYDANGYDGVAVGDMANGSTNGVALGGLANGCSNGVAVGREANGTQTNVAIGMRANAQGGTERIAIGHNVINAVNNTAAIRGHLYLDGGTGIWYRADFGDGSWTAKAFEIDHPLDPENKILRHFCLEGPQVWNVYAGNVQLVDGQAKVQLPDYYSALNLVGSEVYCLTPIGRVLVWIEKKIENNRFIIGGDKDIEVSWTIKVLRNDPGCLEDLRGRPVEELKKKAKSFMKNESWQWLQYAEENCRVAALCFESELFNACLQNAQQAVEKALKALSLTAGLPLKKTRSIAELVADLRRAAIEIEFLEDDIDLLDSIYLPSKYPLGSVLPDFCPDHNLAQRCLTLANHVIDEVRGRMST